MFEVFWSTCLILSFVFIGTFPTTLGLFSSTLQILVLDDNSLTGTLPTELGLLKNLEYFSITGNELTGNVPNEICDITESQGGGFLQTLDVDCESVDCDCCLYC